MRTTERLAPSEAVTDNEYVTAPKTKQPWPRRVLSLLGWGFFVAFVIAVWPVALGGPTSFVVVTGHSMEPTLHAGDFVVLRKGDYQVGDVVSYEPFADMSAQVIHRILEFQDDGTMILQGDNNGFKDPFFPTVDDVTGKMLFSIPKIGSLGWFLGQPLVWGSMLLLAGALLLYKSPSQKAPATAEEIGREIDEDDGSAASGTQEEDLGGGEDEEAE